MNYKILLKNNLIFLSILIIPLMQSNANAGAWTQKKGSGYYKMDFRYLSGTKIYNSDGVKIPVPEFTDITIGIFGSYGITDEFTGFLGVAPYRSVKVDTTAAAFGSDTEVSGFGDIALGGKYRLAKFGKSVISGKLILVLPTGKSEPDSGLWIGSNDFHQTLGLEYGYSLYPVPAYLNAGISFSNRAKGFSDQFNYAIEAGYRFFKNLSLIVRLHGQVSFKNGDDNIYGGFGTFSNNQQFIAYNAELVYKFTNNIGIKGYYESGTKGKNIISAPVFNFGLFFTN